MKYLVFFILLLFSGPAYALGAGGTGCSPPNCSSIYNAGNNGLNGPVTVALLPSAVLNTNQSYTVTDWNGTPPCNGHGGGSTRVICISDGANWIPQQGASATETTSYTATAGSWSPWTTVPATLKDALDRLASAMRAVYAVTFGHYDRVVDGANSIVWAGFTPTTYSGPCQAMSRSIDSYLLGSTTVPWRVRWVGSVTINQASTASYLSSEYGVCVPVVPASSYSSDFPVMSSAATIVNKQLMIDWDGLDITFSPTGQTKPIVAFQFGNLYGVGWTNAAATASTDNAASAGIISNGIITRGSASITVSAGSSAGWTAGVVPQLPFDATNAQMSQTTFIGVFDNGMLRSNFASAVLNCNGVQADLDNICWLHAYGWDDTFPYISSIGFATGIQTNGNTADVFPGGFIETAQVGFISGGPLNTQSVSVSNNCLGGGTPPNTKCTRRLVSDSGWHLKNFVIEGNTLGDIVVAACRFASVEDTWTEMGGSETGDANLFGAGFCNTTHTPCSQDSQCVARGHGTTCQDPALYSAGGAYGNGSVGSYYTDITLMNWLSGGDQGDAAADHLAFGPGFRDITGDARAIFIGGYIGPITDGGANNNKAFSFHPSASGQINMFSASYDRSTTLKPTGYPGQLIWGAENYTLITRTSNYAMNNISTGNDGKFCFKEPRAITLKRVSGSTTANTATITLYERAESSPNSGTTNLLSSGLNVSSTGTAATTSFADSAIAANAPICLGISASTMTSTDVLNLAIEYQDQ